MHACRSTLEDPTRELAGNQHYATKPAPDAQARLLRLLAALRADALARGSGDREAVFWAQVLESADAHARAVWAAPINTNTAEANNARDTQMGRNLVWLANVWYPGRKIIVWAANSHIAREAGPLTTIDGQRPYQTGWSVHMGGEAHNVLGTQMYAIGFTAGTGSFGRFGITPTTLPPPRTGSLEAYFMQVGMTNAFVDFRSAPAGGEWLHNTWMRPFGYAFMRGDWPRVLDGMVYTQSMTPSTAATR